MIANLDDIINYPVRTLYLTLTHLTKCPTCTHAFGMKFIESIDFNSTGFGITDLGFKIIDKCLNNDKARIYPDIKHMSLQSRLQYYDYIKDKNIPIVASHMAVTGISYNKMPVHKIVERTESYVVVEYVNPKGLMDTEFNPWSINMYDEDILEVIKSDGIIGVILDERVLGFRVKEEKSHEVFSSEEFEKYEEQINNDLGDYQALAIQRKFEEDNRNWYNRKYGIINKRLRHFCNNILHIVEVGGEDAWNHISIGSDFDGLIDAINAGKNAERYNVLARKMRRMLVKMAKSNPGTNYYINNIRNKVDGIMHKNAERFLEKYFV